MTKTEKLTAILEGARFRRKGRNSYFYKAKDTEGGLFAERFLYGNGKKDRDEGFIGVEDSIASERLAIGTDLIGKSALVEIDIDDLELL